VAPLRDALRGTGDQLGARLDSQNKDGARATDQIGQLRSQYATLAKKVDVETKAIRQTMTDDFETFETLQGPVQRVQELNRVVNRMQGVVEKHGEALTGVQNIRQSVQNLRQGVQSLQKGAKGFQQSIQNLRQAVRDSESKLQDLNEFTVQLDNLESLVREHDSWLNDLQKTPR